MKKYVHLVCVLSPGLLFFLSLWCTPTQNPYLNPDNASISVSYSVKLPHGNDSIYVGDTVTFTVDDFLSSYILGRLMIDSASGDTIFFIAPQITASGDTDEQFTRVYVFRSAGYKTLRIQVKTTSNIVKDSVITFTVYEKLSLPDSLLQKPVITQEPVNRTASLGSTVAFTIVAQGTPPFTYSWYKANSVAPLGSDSAKLVFTSVSGADSGGYYCIVSNSAGKDTSVTVTLTLTQAAIPPTIIAEPHDSAVFLGNAVSFACAAEGTAPISYQWYKGSAIAHSDSNKIVFSSVSTQDTGSYVCIVSNSAGKDTTQSAHLTLKWPVPQISITSSPLSGIIPLTVRFQAIKDTVNGGPVTSWAWDFKDGQTASTNKDTISHIFTATGNYTVSLTGNGPGGSAIATKTITATELAPVIDFTSDKSSGNKPLTVIFSPVNTGSPITTYAWDFGDGVSATTQSASHTYSATGNYTVVLTVTGPGGTVQKTKSNFITVNENGPVMNITTDVTSGVWPLTVSFSGSTTAGPVTTWGWNFGDSSTVVSTQNASHTFAAAGSYTVTLTGTGSGGTASATKNITVSEKAPVMSIVADVTSGAWPLAVSFTGTTTGGPVTTWAWNFGDGATAATQNASHTFGAAGNYTVSLTGIGAGGTASTTRAITVNEKAPVPNFSANSTTITRTSSVIFTPSNTGGPITTYSWTFGDGQSSTLQQPSHAYNTIGTYSVTLTVSGPGGSVPVTKNSYITVTPIPPSNLVYPQRSMRYTTNEAVTANTPSYSGDQPISFSISPALPTGLAINASTGVISGTATQISASSWMDYYKITASNSGGSALDSVGILIAPVIVLTPAGGEIYHIGQVMNITWKTDPTLSPAIYISLSTDRGRSYFSGLMDHTVSRGSLEWQNISWIVPDSVFDNSMQVVSTISSNCLIGIHDDIGGFGLVLHTNDYFTIVP